MESLLVLVAGALAASAAPVVALADNHWNMKSPSLVVVGLAAALVAALMAYRQNSKTTTSDAYEEEVVELLALEKHVRRFGPISTLTWFYGDYNKKAVSVLRDRMDQILQTNPWLAGRVTQRQGKLVLVYSKMEKDIISVRNKHFQIISEEVSPVARDMTVGECDHAASALIVVNGTQPLFQVAVVPCKDNPSKRFGLLVSISHAIADGHTFYTIHGMLCGKEIRPLVVRRIATTREQQIAVKGKTEYFLTRSPVFLLNMVSGLIYAKLFGIKVHRRYFVVDPSAMKEAKALAAQDGSVPFCSTNDVLTNYFLQECGTSPPHGFMAINWRNRLKGHTDDHAGNYESFLFFTRKDSKTPGLVRKAVSTFKRAVTANSMPSSWQFATGSGIMATNWASFADANVISADCEEDLHIPLLSASLWRLPCTMTLAIIFRAGPGKLAICMAGTEKQVTCRRDGPFLPNTTMV